MVSLSSSLLDFSDNDEGEHEYQDHHGDYSARMDELFTDQGEEDEEGSPSHSPRSEGVEATKATYRERLRDVLGSDATGEDDDLDRLSSLGNASLDDEHPTRSTPDPQRPVSLTIPPGIHVYILNALPTTDNSRRTCRNCVIRPTFLCTIHDVLPRPVRLPPPCSPEYENPVPPPDDIPTAFFPHTSALATKLNRYVSFPTIQRTFTRIITPLRSIERPTESGPTGGGPSAAPGGLPMGAVKRDLEFCLLP